MRSDRVYSFLPACVILLLVIQVFPDTILAQTTVTSSNLPIIVIDTQGKWIEDEFRIVADMGIIDNGPDNRNTITDPFNNYSGKISIELRGESSQMFPKKSFRIETQDNEGNNLNTALLGMAPENDWILYAPYTDKTLMRDVLTYKLGRDLGSYTPRTRFVELVVNDSYEGVYVLMENIKRDKNRVNISELKPEDVSGEDISGGYILRVDKTDFDEYPSWESVPNPQIFGAVNIGFQFHDPKGDELVQVQRDYIQNFIQKVGSSLTSSTFDSENGFRKYVDIQSFIDFMLVNEIGKNIDGYLISTYMYKEKDNKSGKLFMGPLWDFNLAYGNVDYSTNAQNAPGWMWSEQHRMFWFRRMMQDPAFSGMMKCRWTELRETFLTDDYFTEAIDSIASVLNEAQQRNYERWTILGTYVWPNQFIGATYKAELDFMKLWIHNRLHWMDLNMPGTCILVTKAADEVDTKRIEIHPNPSEQDFYISKNGDNFPSVSQVSIFNVLGQQVYESSEIADGFLWGGTIEGKNAPPGLYIALIRSGNQTSKHRIIKK